MKCLWCERETVGGNVACQHCNFKLCVGQQPWADENRAPRYYIIRFVNGQGRFFYWGPGEATTVYKRFAKQLAQRDIANEIGRIPFSIRALAEVEPIWGDDIVSMGGTN